MSCYGIVSRQRSAMDMKYHNLRSLLCLLLFPHDYYYLAACNNKNVGMFMDCYGWVFTACDLDKSVGLQ